MEFLNARLRSAVHAGVRKEFSMWLEHLTFEQAKIFDLLFAYHDRDDYLRGHYFREKAAEIVGALERVDEIIRTEGPALARLLVQRLEPLKEAGLVGLLVASTPWNLLPSEVVQTYQVEHRENFSLEANYSTEQFAYLCSEHVALFSSALSRGKFMVIGDCLALKLMGKRMAYCIQSASSPLGTFIEGNWYATAKKTRDVLTNLWNAGTLTVEDYPSVWGYVRPHGLHPRHSYWAIDMWQGYKTRALTSPVKHPY